MMKRRIVLRNISLAAIGYSLGLPAKTSHATFDYPFVDYWSEESIQSRKARTGVFGTHPAIEKDIRTAEQIIHAAPNTSPLDTMNYFADLTERGSTGEYFNERWRYYGNPAIVWFFHATQTTPNVPNGDCTPWCAAFLSWCLERAGVKSMHSASSQSYLDYPNETKAPRIGDIVIFQNVGDASRGHVALYIEEDAQRVRILGGNQGSQNVRIPDCPKEIFFTRIGREWRAKTGKHQFVKGYRRYVT